MVLSLVYNISSPFRHNRKPLNFQWALTLGNAGIEILFQRFIASIPIENLMASGCDETETIYYKPGFRPRFLAKSQLICTTWHCG